MYLSYVSGSAATREWRSARVFISSTFHDMHAERNLLVLDVFPELRDRLRRHRVNLRDIDLRWGISREDAVEDRVAEICSREIDACRPLFIGLLGERYGGAPGESGAASYTELEVRHALADPRTRRAALFYFRDPEALAGLPTARVKDFREADPAARGRLERLKDDVRSAGAATSKALGSEPELAHSADQGPLQDRDDPGDRARKKREAVRVRQSRSRPGTAFSAPPSPRTSAGSSGRASTFSSTASRPGPRRSRCRTRYNRDARSRG